MPRAHIVRSTPIQRTARVMQLEGMFDVPPTERSETAWDVNLPIEEKPWNIGLIVGASGSGKTTLARELFGAEMIDGYEWPAEKSIVDAFPASLGIKDVTGLLSSVGFSSPPSWLRPFHVLSNGEKFRVTIARALAESPDLAVIDEFTSVVDRTVARIGSSAIAKTVRRRKQKLIAVACHYDIIEWLQPDWIYEPGTDSFQWRELQRRPSIDLKIERVHRSAWKLFQHHHYLSHNLHPAAAVFCAFVEGRPAAFTAVLSFPHGTRSGWREHRTVCLPDFQGVGIGNAMSEYVASLFVATGKPYFSVTSHPAMITHRAGSKLWNMHRKASRVVCISPKSTIERLKKTNSRNRLTAGFEYMGAARPNDARMFGLKVEHVKRPSVSRVTVRYIDGQCARVLVRLNASDDDLFPSIEG